jgi:thymidylate synthase (FAD)
MNKEIKLLDHGYLRYVESWGSDKTIIESARMSTDKGFLGWGPREDNSPGDEKLLAFLWKHKHSTPFEFSGMTIEVQAPILVFREWHRHRTQSYSELSARYTPLPDTNYVPTVERCMIVSGTNKQAGAIKGADELTHESVLAWLEELDNVYKHAEAVYRSGLKRGIPKEVARASVPVGRYSRMRASGNLRNWLAFLTLRTDPNAQWEIRQYANALSDIIKVIFPRTHALWADSAPL